MAPEAISRMWLTEKCLSLSSFSKAWIQSQGEVQKSSVLSDYLNNNMLKVYEGIFLHNDTKNKQPTPTLICQNLLYQKKLSYIFSKECETFSRNANIGWMSLAVFWKCHTVLGLPVMVTCGRCEKESVRLLRGLTLRQMWPAAGFPIHCTDECEYTLCSLDIAQQPSLKSGSVTVTHKPHVNTHSHTHTHTHLHSSQCLSFSDVSIATAGRHRTGRRDAVVSRTLSKLSSES